MSDAERFLVHEHPGLSRAAYLLTGDPSAAQDLVQETAVRVLLQWSRVARAQSPAAYTRRIMLNAFLGRRRRAWRREVPGDALPEPAPGDPPYAALDDRDVLRRALLQLPARQRAAVVLRHYEDRSEVETAQLMGCSVGNVKALTSRGLSALRAALSDDAPEGTAAR